jgi:hypothetical protein
MSRRTFLLALMGAVWLGFAVRLGYVLSGDFPLHDGGLFVQMVQDLQRAHYALPATTTYNHAGIPFSYPPLGLYAAGLLSDATRLDLLTVFRFLPLLVSTLSIVAFLPLARRLLAGRTQTAVAAFAFALVPRSFEWMIMGGGMTRSFGFLFAILALHQVHLLCTTHRTRYAVSAGILAGLTLLSHVEMAWFLAFSSALFWVAFARDRATLLRGGIVAACAVAVASPWWLTVLLRDGASPFLAAMRTSSQVNPLLQLIAFRPTDEPMFALLAGLALLGALASLARHHDLIPAWVLLCALLDPRAFGTVGSPAIALLAAVAAVDVLLPLARGHHHGAAPSGGRHAPRWLAPAALIAGALYITLSALIAQPLLVTAMSHDERDGMAWVQQNTPPDSRVLVVTADRWFADRTSEWFPQLTGRESVATVQGYEWASGGAFATRMSRYDAVQECANKDGDCLAAWTQATGVGFDYVYVPKLAPRSALTVADRYECCAGLRNALRADARYAVAFDGPGATVFHLK